MQISCKYLSVVSSIRGMPSPVASRQFRRQRLRAVRWNAHDREILRLAIPAFGALVAEPLFLLADSAIVGRIGTVPLGGLGVASQALTTLVGISIFLAYGTTAAVARQLGAGQPPGRDPPGHRRALAGHADRRGRAGPGLAARAGDRARVRRHAAGVRPGHHYLRISLLGAPAMLLVLAGTGVLRGLQDTRTPLAVAVAANARQRVLNASLCSACTGASPARPGARSSRRPRRPRVPGHGARGARRAGVPRPGPRWPARRRRNGLLRWWCGHWRCKWRSS